MDNNEALVAAIASSEAGAVAAGFTVPDSYDLLGETPSSSGRATRSSSSPDRSAGLPIDLAHTWLASPIPGEPTIPTPRAPPFSSLNCLCHWQFCSCIFCSNYSSALLHPPLNLVCLRRGSKVVRSKDRNRARNMATSKERKDSNREVTHSAMISRKLRSESRGQCQCCWGCCLLK